VAVAKAGRRGGGVPTAAAAFGSSSFNFSSVTGSPTGASAICLASSSLIFVNQIESKFRESNETKRNPKQLNWNVVVMTHVLRVRLCRMVCPDSSKVSVFQ